MNNENTTTPTPAEDPKFEGAQSAEAVADRLDRGARVGQGSGDADAPAPPTTPYDEDAPMRGNPNDGTRLRYGGEESLPAALNPDTPRAGARDDVGLIDHTAQGEQILAGDTGTSIKLGAEIEGGAAALLGVTRPVTMPEPMQISPRHNAHALLIQLRDVEIKIADFEATKGKIRDELKAALEAIGPDADDQKIVTAIGQASVNDAPRRVKIVGDIPSDMMKTVPDEKKIGDSLRAGNVVKGAELSNGGEKVLRVTWPKSER